MYQIEFYFYCDDNYYINVHVHVYYTREEDVELVRSLIDIEDCCVAFENRKENVIYMY